MNEKISALQANVLNANELSKATINNIEKESPTSSLEEKVREVVQSMSQREKIGQLMMIGIHGTELNTASLRMLHEYKVGGVILFDRNMRDKEQVKKLNAELQSIAGEKVPLFIAIDEEGGEVVRMADELNPPPSQSSIGQSGQSETAKEWAIKTAHELKDMGFNINFAPVADIALGNSRSYSSQPDVVTDFVMAAAAGYEQEKFLYSLKHFPGIGRGTVDSHLDRGEINVPIAILQNEDLMPFKAAIKENDFNRYLIMISHFYYSAFDEKNPASLSRVIMTDLLRNELGYKGIIITDDMEMGAVAKSFDFTELGIRSIEAGADIILICHEYEHQIAVYNGILKALEEDRLSESRLNESVTRIVKAKLMNLL